MKENSEKLSVQERFGRAAQEGIEAARQMTGAEVLAQARLNSGFRTVRIVELPIPGARRNVGAATPRLPATEFSTTLLSPDKQVVATGSALINFEAKWGIFYMGDPVLSGEQFKEVAYLKAENILLPVRDIRRCTAACQDRMHLHFSFEGL